MKILLWAPLFFPNIGGLEKMVYSLAVSLQSRDHEVIVLANAKKKEELSIGGIPVFTFPFISSLFEYRLPLIRETLEGVFELLERFSPDVVNIHGWFECFAFYQARIFEKSKVPVCLSLHGLLEQESHQTENCLKLWNRAQAVSTVSDAIVPDIPHPFIQTIYNGLPLSKTPLKALCKNELLLVGRFSEEKCFHVAFHSLKLLLPDHPNLRLTLVGDGPDYDKLLQLKQSLDLPIEMPGFVSPHETQDFFDRSTLVIIPSSYESFSLVALEAALRGRPVVASSVLGLKEVVEDGKTGLLVEPEDPSALAAAIHTLLLNPLQMEQMGLAAFKRASNLFNIETTTDNYLRMYERSASAVSHKFQPLGARQSAKFQRF